MLSIAIITLAVAAVASGEDCSDHASYSSGLVKYYKELGCLPVMKSGERCPSRFDCDAALARRVPGMCYLKGRTYDKNTHLADELIGDKCLTACQCQDGADIECANIECPEDFDSRPENCELLFSQDSCCSTGLHCTNNKTAANKAFTCDYEGKSYVIGQEFNQMEKPCLTCSCQEGYDGTLKAPWCTEVSCSIEIHYADRIRDGCAPIYFGKKGCCPIDWRCPDKSDTVIKATEGVSKNDTAECVFGSLHLKLGDKLDPGKESCVECKCSLPPQITCIKTDHC